LEGEGDDEFKWIRVGVSKRASPARFCPVRFWPVLNGSGWPDKAKQVAFLGPAWGLAGRRAGPPSFS